jgi:hypothetical protein
MGLDFKILNYDIWTKAKYNAETKNLNIFSFLTIK